MADLAVRGVPGFLEVAQQSSCSGGEAVTVAGGSLTRLSRLVQAFSQGQSVGRWSTIRRADDATRAGTVNSFRRMVAGGQPPTP